MSRALIASSLIYFFLLPLGKAQRSIIHVPGDSTTMQCGTNSVVNGDTVMVAHGTYYVCEIDFLGKAITVTSMDTGVYGQEQ